MMFDYLMAKYQGGRYTSALSANNEAMLIEDLTGLAFEAINQRDPALIQLLGYAELELKTFFDVLEQNNHFDDGYSTTYRSKRYSVLLATLMCKKAISFNGVSKNIDDELALVAMESFGVLQDPFRRSITFFIRNLDFNPASMHGIYLDPQKGALDDNYIFSAVLLGADITLNEKSGFLFLDNLPDRVKCNPIVGVLNGLNNDDRLIEHSAEHFNMARDKHYNAHPLLRTIELLTPAFGDSVSLMRQTPKHVESFYRNMTQELALLKPMENYISGSMQSSIDQINGASSIAQIQQFIGEEFDLEPIGPDTSAQRYISAIVDRAAHYRGAIMRMNQLAANLAHDSQIVAESRAAVAVLGAFGESSAYFIESAPDLDISALTKLLFDGAKHDDFSTNWIHDISSYCPLEMVIKAVEYSYIEESDLLLLFHGLGLKANTPIRTMPHREFEQIVKLVCLCDAKYPGILKHAPVEALCHRFTYNDKSIMADVVKHINRDKVNINSIPSLADDEGVMTFMNSPKL